MNTNPTTRPVTFNGCFGWLHLPAVDRAATGVVLCNPFGNEALCVHRGWRDFAESVTVACGMAVLRFDYPGTGDSEGVEEDPARFCAWVDSIKAATEYLRTVTGVTRIVLCGLRLGATLAVLAAEELADVEGVVLMAPVIVGKRYIRELRMQHQSCIKALADQEAAQSREAVQGVGALGFDLYADALEKLASIDLTKRLRSPAPRVLLHDISVSESLNKLVECFRGHGASADVRIFPEYDSFLLPDPTFCVPPRGAFDSVLEWLGSRGGTSEVAAAEILQPSAHARINFAGGHETPVVFGSGRYVGVMCKPRNANEHAPAVLIMNTAGVHRVGCARHSVLMARRLAAQGITSLRMDLGGVGDSSYHDDKPNIEGVYARHSIADATAGVERLIAAGHSGVVMFGVCAGAYVSVHTTLKHPAVVGCISVNLPFFFWGAPRRNSRAPSQVYMRSVRDPRKWLLLLTGRSDLRRIAVSLVRRWCERSSVRRLLMALEKRHVPTSLVYGPLDAGLDEVPKASYFEELEYVTATVLEQLDHSLYSRTARNVVSNYVEAFLLERAFEAGRPNVVDCQSRHASAGHTRPRGILSPDT